MTKENQHLAIATISIGFAAGIGAIALSLFLELVSKCLLDFKETALAPALISISPFRRILILAGSGFFAAVIWWLLRNRSRPLVSVAEAVAGQSMPFVATLIHTFTQMLFVGAGGSVGRELAPRELAAALAQRLIGLGNRHRNLALTQDDVHLLIAAAAGAGFAGVYIAPITGALFSLEILYKQVSRKAVIVSLTMSSTAMLIGAMLKGFRPYYLVNSGPFSARLVGVIVFLAPLCGIIGGYFRRAVQWATIRQAHGRSLLWQLPLMAVITAIVACLFPQITGNGRAIAQLVFNQERSDLVWIFLGAGALKAIVTVLTIRAGAAGGTLTPSIAIGATLGFAIGTLWNYGGPSLPLWQCALLGAAGVLAASQQAPLMAMFMLFEVSHLDYSALLPLSVMVCLAVTISQKVLSGRKDGEQLTQQSELLPGSHFFARQQK